jgi:hypothetical protein
MLIFAIGSEDDRQDVEEALGVSFESHHSLYLGGDYWLARLSGSSAEVRIRSNVDLLWSPSDPESERFAYARYAEHQLLLEVDSESPDILQRLLQCPTLRLVSPDLRNGGSEHGTFRRERR